MFKLFGRNIKKSVGLFLIFFVISLFFSVTTCYIENTRQSLIEANEFFSDNSTIFQIMGGNNGSDKISGSDLINVISKSDGIILGENIGIDKGNNESIAGYAIYFNKSCFNIPPILTGRFFTVNDFNKDEPIALIGKNLREMLITKDNKKYLFYDNTYYRIIGIMGYKNKSSIYDKKFAVNLNAILSDPEKFSRDLNKVMWRVDNRNSNARNSIKDIYNGLSKVNKNIQIQIENQNSRFSPLTTAFNVNKDLITSLIIFILVLFFNIINVSLFWVSEMKKEIGVRKALGGTNKSIALKIMFKYEIIGITAAFSALMLHVILSKYTNIIKMFGIYYGDASVSLVSILALTAFSLVIGFMASLIPIRQILKMEISDIIRGR